MMTFQSMYNRYNISMVNAVYGEIQKSLFAETLHIVSILYHVDMHKSVS